jgi:hypothetical protein
LVLRRILTLGGPLVLAALLPTAGAAEATTPRVATFALVLLGLSIEIAASTTEKPARYGATGMAAAMAAMMAAMGSGLAAGYAAGMVWSLAWASLAGVLIGVTHGLVMGRRYGPMAALDGAGGGVAGGLMGPMLVVMVLATGEGPIATALLMIALQGILSLGGVYLVASSVVRVGSPAVLHVVGRMLGSAYRAGPGVDECLSTPAAARPADGHRQRGRARSTKVAATGAATRAGARMRWRVVALVGVAALAIFAMGGGPDGGLVGAGAAGSSVAGPPVAAILGQDGVQELSMTLRYPRYEPRLMEAQAGVPLRLSLQALGEPGWGQVTLVRGFGQRLIARANQTGTVEFVPDRPGDYSVNCSMNVLVAATLRIR